MKRHGVANIFHARCVILKMNVFYLSLHESTVVINRDAHPEMNKFTLCCQIINSLESVAMEGNRGYG